MVRTFLLLAMLGLAGPAHAVSLIQLDFDGPMSDIERQTFLDAADFWNSAITGYKLHSDAEGNPTPHNLTITASVTAIDGPGQVLGAAHPLTVSYYDNDPFSPNPTMALYYATTGLMEFDSADVNLLVANQTFYGVVLHEMAHVLGFGTLWEANNDVNGTTYSLYLDGSGRYTGPNALAQWRTEFNQPLASFVPVELEGEEGTANGHWNEALFGIANTGISSVDHGLDFRNELMTGWSSDPFFVSRTTLGAIEDLGYTVDYSMAGIVSHTVVPEASSLALGLVAAGFALRRRR